jgi:hypothetical protein
MPITPFHFGPAVLIKVFVRNFSFRIFVLANILIDVEPGYYLLIDQPPFHRFFHSYLGATIVAVITALVGIPLCRFGTNVWNMLFKRYKIEQLNISAGVLIISALIGTYSHVLLDSLMHWDMAPFQPFSKANPLINAIGFAEVHWLCLILGIIGGILLHRRKV